MQSLVLSGRTRLYLLLLALLTVLAAVLATSATAYAVNLMNIYDGAHVLDQDRVIQAADGVGYNIDLYTTATFAGDAGELASFAHQHVTTHQVGMLVIVIDTQHRHLAIQDNGTVSNNQVSFSEGQYQNALNAFRAAIGRNDYTAATVAVLRSLSNAASTTRTWNTLKTTGIVLLVLLLIAAAVFGRGGGGSPAGPSTGDTLVIIENDSPGSGDTSGGIAGTF